jgi:aldehyde dehydrogenase (NAD+)
MSIHPSASASPPPSIREVFHRQKDFALEWRQSALRQRKQLLKAFRLYILDQADAIHQAVRKDLGKPVAEVNLSEIYPVVSEINHIISHLDDWSRPVKVDAPLSMLGTRSEIRYEPRGVCLIIAPWNFPFMLAMGPLVSCLAAGNTAIVKPSELTPHTSALISKMIREFFKPEHVSVVEGGIEETTSLLKLPFDHIFFTGSPSVGKIVMKAAAENLTSVTLELGGKSPAIVDETARLDDAAKRIAHGKLLNNGQACIAPDYIWVHASVKEAFVVKLRHFMLQHFGEGKAITEQSPDYARIVNTRNFQRLDALVRDALQKGARAEWSGEINEASRFLHPTLLSEVPMEAHVMNEEIFGPILPIISYTDENEVIRYINEQPKALALYVFTTRSSFFEKVMKQTSSGTACLNDCVLQFAHANLPFGGVNNSGMGAAHGEAGFRAFSHAKSILKQRNGFTFASIVYPPYTRRVRGMIQKLIQWL